MDSEDENNLTCNDAFGKMCADIRAIVRERGSQFGYMYYPTMKNPAIIVTHGNGIISQVDVVFEEAQFDEEGQIILPEHTATYRAS